jgi:hypothetical protein
MSKHAQPAPPANPTPAALPVGPGLDAALAILEPLSIAILFVYLLDRTWLRWPDPLIDFPRELYTAWRLSVGDLLYRDVTCWYGPLPHLVEAFAFRIFGVGLDTVVWLNIGVTTIVLLLLRGIFGRLGGRLSMWLCSVVFLVVFAFGHFVMIGNYNFITPYASQATYGVAGLLLVLWALLHHAHGEKSRWLVIAGAGLGVVYVCKPEPVLAAGGALAVYFIAMGLRRADVGSNWIAALARFARDTGWVAAGFFGVWTPVFAVLGYQGGLTYAFSAVNWVPYTVLSSKFRTTGLSSTFNLGTLGFDQPWEHLVEHLVAAGWLIGVCALVMVGGWIWARERGKGREAWLGMALLAIAGGYAAWRLPWLLIGRAILFPVVLLALVIVCWSWWTAWKGRMDFPRTLQLATVGTGGALMLARMPLSGRIEQYGFFMEPLAMLFVVNLLVAEAPRWLAGRWRVNWLLQAVFALMILFGVRQLGQRTMFFFDLETYAVGEGRDQFYSFPAYRASNGQLFASGPLLNTMIQAVRKYTPAAKTLLALPETAALNYHLRLRDPIPEMEFQPTTLTFVGLDQVMQDLQNHPPDAVLVYSRSLNEYGVPYFGADQNSGLAILQWLRKNYGLVAYVGANDPFNGSGHYFDLLRRRPTPNPATGK